MQFISCLRAHVQSRAAALVFLACAATAHADSYINGVLTLTTLAIGSGTYSNVVISPIALGDVDGYTKGSTRTGSEDSYDPATGRLTIPVITVGNSTFTNVTVTVPASAVVSIGSVTGADTYAGGNLTIAGITVGGKTYNDVVLAAKVSDVVMIAGGLPSATSDQYTPSSGHLLIPAVQVGNRVYTNVTIKASPSGIQSIAPPNPTIGGQIKGLTGTGLVLTLIDNGGTDNSQTSQTLAVGAGATTFTFAKPLPYSASAVTASTIDFFSALVSTQPAGQTCGVTDGYGGITSPASFTTVQVTCVATENAHPTLQGAFQLSTGGTSVTKWLAFAPDGTYIFIDVQYPPNPAAGCYGDDYGAYSTTASTLTFVNALVYLPLANPPANCGFTDGQGNIGGGAVPFTVSGSGQNTIFTLTNPGATFTGAAVPSIAGSLVGAWSFGPGLDQGLVIFGTDGHYLVISTQADPTGGIQASTGVEYGCYSTSGVTPAGGTFNYDTSSACAGAVTTPGVGYSVGGQFPSGSFPYATPDANTLQQIFGTLTFSYTRFAPN